MARVQISWLVDFYQRYASVSILQSMAAAIYVNNRQCLAPCTRNVAVKAPHPKTGPWMGRSTVILSKSSTFCGNGQLFLTDDDDEVTVDCTV